MENESRQKCIPLLEKAPPFPAISPLCRKSMQEALERQAELTKPAGSLGALEEASVNLAGIFRTSRPRITTKVVVVAAADHGVTAEGVSAYPAEVTAQMVANFATGGAAVNVLARATGAQVTVVDVGVAKPLPLPDVLSRRVGPGTANFTAERAMSLAQAYTCVDVGLKLAASLPLPPGSVVCLGEMGIGNTTAASALTAVFCGANPALVVGTGTGLTEEATVHKVGIIKRALKLHKPSASQPWEVLSQVGGFEIGTLAGLAIGAAARGACVVIDGFISGAAALLALALCPPVDSYLLASHLSTEPGHRVQLAVLEKEPLINLKLRLGEGSGAVLTLPILEAACAVLSEMATFSQAQVSGRLAQEVTS